MYCNHVCFSRDFFVICTVKGMWCSMNSDNEWGRTWKFNSVSFCSLSIVCQKPSNGWIENVTGKAYLRQISPSPKFVPEYKDVPPPRHHCKRQYEGGLVVFPVPIHIRGKMGRRKFRMAKQSSANKRLHL